MGRGRALEWYDQGDDARINALVARRLARIRRFERRGYTHYVEASQYFIQTFGEATAQMLPGFGIVKLTRDPIECARSYANRDKDPFVNRLPPDRRSNLFRISNWSGLSAFQHYARHWIECEARYYDLVSRHEILPRFEIWTNELGDPKRLAEMFDCFGIEHRTFDRLEPLNTNPKLTRVSADDEREFEELVALVPDQLAEKIPTLAPYRRSSEYVRTSVKEKGTPTNAA